MRNAKYFVFALIVFAAAAVLSSRVSGRESSENCALTIEAATCRGPARGFVEVLQHDDETGMYISFTKKPLLKGAITLEGLPAGTYRAVITTSEEIEPQVKVVDDIRIEAGDKTRRKVLFEQAAVELVALDRDGKPLEGRLSLRRYDASAKAYVPVAHRVLAVSGRAAFHLAPGRYDITFIPDDIVGCRGISSGPLDLSDKQTYSFRPSVAYGYLVVEAKNFLGAVPSRLTVFAKGSNGRKLDPLFTRTFDGGAATIRALPGRYSVEVAAEPGTILPPVSRSFEPVEIQETKREHVSAYFECARLGVEFRAYGRTDARVELQKWNRETKSFAAFDSIPLETARTNILLQVGRYRAIVVDQSVSPPERYALDNFEVADRDGVVRKVKLNRAQICIVARLAPGTPAGTVALYRRENKVERRVLSRPLKDGETLLRVAEGEYRVVTTVGANSKVREFAGRWRRATDRARLMEVLDLGSANAGPLPPRVDLSGPFEVGDGDGVFEVGERAKFSTTVSGADGATTQIFIIEPTEQGSRQVFHAALENDAEDRDREFIFDRSGIYTIRIISRRDDGGEGEIVIERKLTVVEKN